MSEFRTVHLWYKSPDYLYEASARTSVTLDKIIAGEPLGTADAILVESRERLAGEGDDV